MIAPVIGLCVGIFIGVFSQLTMPEAYSAYAAIGILACADSVLGGLVASMENRFDWKQFLAGFFGNGAVAVLLVFFGNRLNIALSTAAIVFYGSRIFNNFSRIRRFLLNKNEKKDMIE